MRRTLGRSAVAVAILSVLAGPAPSSASATITIVHVNDSHSHLDATGHRDANLDGTIGGIAKVATVLQTIRASDANVLALHAGDVFQGDLFFNAFLGVPELQLLDALGFQAMAVGNHEFDLGPDGLAFALSQAFPAGGLPLLSANADLSAVPQLALERWIRPSIIKEVGGVKFGIFGLTVPDEALMRNGAVRLLGADASELFAVAAEQVALLRAQGVDVVILLSHLGLARDEAVAANVPGIDIVVGGHDHFELPQPIAVARPGGGTTLVVQAGSHYEKVGRMRFTVDAGTVTLGDYALLPVDAAVPRDPATQATVDALKAEIVRRYGDVYRTRVAVAEEDLAKTFDASTRKRDTAMGNLISDALRRETGTDIAVTTLGLISEGIAAGPVVPDDVFRAVSYGFDPATGLGFDVATFDIAGADLVRGLEIGVDAFALTIDFYAQVSGMRFAYDSSLPAGQRVLVDSIRIQGRPIDLSATYSVTSDTGLLLGLPLIGVPVSNVRVVPAPEYSVLLRHVAALGLLENEVSGRIRDVARP
jgi:5'-nucleotidase